MPEHDKYFSPDQDPYLNQKTNTLKNIPQLETPKKLEAFEEIVFQAVFAEASLYIAAQKTIDLSSWKLLHKICFSDVYTWAGDLRTVRIAKDKTVFTYPETITKEADKLFTNLNHELQNNSLTIVKNSRVFCRDQCFTPVQRW